MKKIEALLREVADRNASDLHLKEGRPPLFRISGELLPSDHEALTGEKLRELVFEVIPEALASRVERDLEADFAYLMDDVGRFRINVFFQRGKMGAVMRLIPLDIPTIEQLRLPPVLLTLGLQNQGLILVTGPTGSGKSTSMAAIVEHINISRPVHVVSIEDPIEFVYTDKQATINQREMGIDTWSYDEALRHVLRQDPDVIIMGEMRDQQAMEFALRAAETGHLVLSTLHTNDCKQTLDRILDTFPPEMDRLIRGILAQALLGVVSQRLLPRADQEGRIVAAEVMINSPNIQQLIIADKIGDIEPAMARSKSYYGMQTFNQALARLVTERLVSEKDALQASTSPADLQLLLKGFASGAESIDQLRQDHREDEPQKASPARNLMKGPEEEVDSQSPDRAKRLNVSRGFEF